MPQVVQVLVPGGKATPGPPLGPVLGPLGINVKQVVDAINEKTKAFDGTPVPVKVKVAEDKTFTLEVGTPPVSALILKELGIEKGSKEAGKTFIGDISLEKLVKIVKMKQHSMYSASLKKAVKQAVGTCVSMGVNVEGMNPKEMQKAIDEGKYDSILK
jgi:large subunit ribosomal protein L11